MVPTRRILQMHEFKCNTFAERMIAVFADGHDEMQFEDFLDMASGACVCCVWMGLSPPSSPAVISCDAFPRTRCSPLMGGVTTPAPTFTAAHGVSLVPSSRVVSDTGQYRFFGGVSLVARNGAVFSEHATRDVKASYAFRIYDFDGDGYLGHDDLEQTVRCLVGQDNLNDTQVQETVHQILLESDLDEDNQLSFIEFEHVVSRAPDFANTFRIRI